ncbi:aspartate dehydrogenase [Candidatus Micrarchaeota archaeon]|nr:aspartate dehydrogenase [Candidatus Micrarchaeota archaeon]
MKIGLIGFGSIGSFLAQSLPEHQFLVYDVEKKSSGLKNVKFVPLADLNGCGLVVEAASQEAVPLLLPFLKSVDVMVMSVGAFTDAKLLGEFREEAKKQNHKILIPSGAVGGLDILQACGAEEVVLETRKNPKSLGRMDVMETVLFDGPASEACEKFPKNVNVAAALSLAGIGFEKTRVKVISDPDTEKNTHTIKIKGKTGNYEVKCENFPFEENPKTSALAAYSAVALIRKRSKELQVG